MCVYKTIRICLRITRRWYCWNKLGTMVRYVYFGLSSRIHKIPQRRRLRDGSIGILVRFEWIRWCHCDVAWRARCFMYICVCMRDFTTISRWWSNSRMPHHMLTHAAHECDRRSVMRLAAGSQYRLTSINQFDTLTIMLLGVRSVSLSSCSRIRYKWAIFTIRFLGKIILKSWLHLK